MMPSIGYVVVGYQQLSSLSTAVGLVVPTGANVAIFIAQDQDVRWRDDGTNPTTTVGMLMQKGIPLEYAGPLTAFKMIEAAASAKVNVAYYRTP